MKKLLASLGIVAAVVLGGTGTLALTGSQAQALTIYEPCKDDANAHSTVCQAKDKDSLIVQTVQRIITILLFIIGIIAVIVIVIAGIMYATSGGNSEQTKKAKDAILYAVIGIIVAVMAYAIVGFVTQNIK